MKGFPNQVADLSKLAKGMRALATLVDGEKDAKNDAVFGEALVRAGVAGTGHTPQPVEEYLAAQRQKPRQNQSFQTTARGLRELYRLFRFIDDSEDTIFVTETGRRAASFADTPMDGAQIAFWRITIRNMQHRGHDGQISHPYQVLLRLISARPGIAKSMCALALEARNDSEGELNRILRLSELTADQARAEIGESQQNWDNAVKVLPGFAEQLGDVENIGTYRDRAYVLADAPGAAIGATRAEQGAPRPTSPPRAHGRTGRAPRSSREVTSKTIGRAGTGEESDEIPVPPELDATRMAEAIKIRSDRLRRHNLLVQELAEQFAECDGSMYESPFDIFVVLPDRAILGEVKTLDGTEADERARVRDALGQLLYYEAFVARPVAGESPIRKIACFEDEVTDEHRCFLNASGIGVIWKTEDGFAGDDLAFEHLGEKLGRLRR